MKVVMELEENRESVLHLMYPNGSKSGNEFIVGDVSGKSGKSLNVCLSAEKPGVWHDFATGESGQILALIAGRYKLDLKSQRALVIAKAQELLAAVSALPAKYVLHNTSPTPTKITQGLKKGAEWDYLNADGSYLYTVIRFEDAAGKKEIRPYNKKTNSHKGHPKPRPLYNLPGIAESSVVIIVEGEKCAQALINAGHCATTAMMGAMTPAHHTDWSPLKDREVLIWPDNDEPGKKYAMNSAEAAMAAGASCCAVLVLPEGLPEGWDAADALADDSTFDVEAFLKDGAQVPMAPPKDAELQAAFEIGDPASEDGIARVLTELFAPDWKYCAAWGRWYFWNDQRWVHDQILAFSYLARQVCRVASSFAKLPGSRTKIASATTAANVERLARADPKHATAVEEWDADPRLLNTPGGIVNLNTGQLEQHQRSRLLTKSTTATPEGECPQWLDFLKTITGDDQELIDYLQRVVGYCLTGLTTEHVLFFLYGTGANGKSVFLNVISTMLGDYAKSAPMETFMSTKSDQHPTDLAGLRGARFVCATETEQGRQWNESKIKTITGGDTISARFMRQDFFEYKPQFKLLIGGNHKPCIANVGEAMARRIHLIPFAITIPSEKRDKDLTDKLLQEKDGILAWAIEGHRQWLEKKKLHPPKAVTEATKEYLDAEDTVARWMDDCCEIGPAFFTSSKEAFQSWKSWAESAGEFAGKQRTLSNQIRAKNFKPLTQDNTRGFIGFAIKEKVPTPWPPNTTPDLADQVLDNQL